MAVNAGLVKDLDVVEGCLGSCTGRAREITEPEVEMDGP